MNLEKLKAKVFEPQRVTYTRKDTMLYALGVGAGVDPLDEVDLRFTYEKNLSALPTQSCPLGSPGFWMQDPVLEMDWVKLLHGEQEIEMYKTLPPEGAVNAQYRVIGVKDNGADKGATVWFEKLLTDDSGEKICAVRSTYMMRGDGGAGDMGERGATPAALPDRTPDRTMEIPTLPRQALLYRLSGDFNPLHSDPEVAAKAGFKMPILHGLCSMGIVCHAVVRTYCGGDVSKLAGLGLRFASPVFPGDTIRLECFEEAGAVRFRARVVERDILVLDRGTAKLR
jgi:acyl dehydratase